MHCTTVTGFQPNCNQQIYPYQYQQWRTEKKIWSWERGSNRSWKKLYNEKCHNSYLTSNIQVINQRRCDEWGEMTNLYQTVVCIYSI